MSLLDQAQVITAQAENLERSAAAGETHGVLLAAGRLFENLQELIAEGVEQGAREGLTQKAMADALGIPPRTLRGLRQAVEAE